MPVGYNKFRRLSTNDTNAASVNAAPCTLKGYHISNTNAAVRFVKLYDKASAPSVGTDTPVLTLAVPPGGVVVGYPPSDKGIPFANGLALGIVVNAVDSDSTAPAANEVVVNLFWE